LDHAQRVDLEALQRGLGLQALGRQVEVAREELAQALERAHATSRSACALPLARAPQVRIAGAPPMAATLAAAVARDVVSSANTEEARTPRANCIFHSRA